MAALVAGTFWWLLRDVSLTELMGSIRSADPVWLLLALGLMFCFVSGEATNLRLITSSLGLHIPFRRCLKYAFVGFYFSSITPSASGGQPMQVYFMKRDGTNVSHSSLSFLLIVAIYQIVMLLFGVVAFFLKAPFILENIKGVRLLLVYGVSVNALLVCGIFFLVFSGRLVRRIAHFFARLFLRLHLVKDPAKLEKSIDTQVAEYQAGARLIRRTPKILFQVLGITAVQILCYYLVPYFIYLALGGGVYSVVDMVAMQAILTLAVSSLPLPGAVGASESSFLIVFRLFFAPAMLLPAMLLSRGVSFYLFLLISGCITLLASMMKRRAAA